MKVNKKGKNFNQSSNSFSSTKQKIVLIWQNISFSTISIILLILFIIQTSKEINKDQIIVEGGNLLGKQEVIKSSGNFFPKLLIEINPKQLELILLKELPIKSIAIRRTILPAKVYIRILERSPIAFAERITKEGKEKGMIDIDAYWIPLRLINNQNSKHFHLSVEGWKSNKKKEISLLLRNRKKISQELQRITLNPNGEINLQTKNLGSILIGSNSDLLQEQIKTLKILQRSLPDLLINTNGMIIDLRDPSKPLIKNAKAKIQ